MTTLCSRDDCTCSCHHTGAVVFHAVACCTGVFKDPAKNAELEAYYEGVVRIRDATRTDLIGKFDE